MSKTQIDKAGESLRTWAQELGTNRNAELQQEDDRVAGEEGGDETHSSGRFSRSARSWARLCASFIARRR